jgi:hypothetical protein
MQLRSPTYFHDKTNFFLALENYQIDELDNLNEGLFSDFVNNITTSGKEALIKGEKYFYQFLAKALTDGFNLLKKIKELGEKLLSLIVKGIKVILSFLKKFMNDPKYKRIRTIIMTLLIILIISVVQAQASTGTYNPALIDSAIGFIVEHAQSTGDFDHIKQGTEIINYLQDLKDGVLNVEHTEEIVKSGKLILQHSSDLLKTVNTEEGGESGNELLRLIDIGKQTSTDMIKTSDTIIAKINSGNLHLSAQKTTHSLIH